MTDFQRDEVAEHFSRWREAVDRRDLDGMSSMLTDDARGGNAQFGISDGREAVMEFASTHWPETVPNRSLWHAIDGSRVVDKWCETLPGEPPAESDYDYHGITELIYAGSGQWRFMYGIPDMVGLMRAHARWCRDGHAESFADVYPGLRK